MEREAEDVDEERADLSREGLPTLLPGEDLQVEGRPPRLPLTPVERLLAGENRPPVVVLKRSLMERLPEVVEEAREGRRREGRPILLPGCLFWLLTTFPFVSSLGCEGTGYQPPVSSERASGTRYQAPEAKAVWSLDAGYHSPTLKWRPCLSSLFTFSTSIFFLKPALSSTKENGVLGKLPVLSADAWILRNIEAEKEKWGRSSSKNLIVLQRQEVSLECSARCSSEYWCRCLPTGGGETQRETYGCIQAGTMAGTRAGDLWANSPGW